MSTNGPEYTLEDQFQHELDNVVTHQAQLQKSMDDLAELIYEAMHQPVLEPSFIRNMRRAALQLSESTEHVIKAWLAYEQSRDKHFQLTQQQGNDYVITMHNSILSAQQFAAHMQLIQSIIALYLNTLRAQKEQQYQLRREEQFRYKPEPSRREHVEKQAEKARFFPYPHP